MIEQIPLDADEQRQLIAAALTARQQAYAPYSGFQVGAALLTVNNLTIVGCNVENASYGLTQCAERTALTAAIAHGHRQFRAVAIAAPGAVTPCGACRQVLAEFCPDLPILLVDADQPDRIVQTSLEALFPGRFHLD